MISQTPEQLMLYNARLKFQRDEEARFQDAIQVGEARGLKVGRITLLQELLGIRLSTVEEFAGYDEGQLTDMADQLQQQLRTRGETA